MAGDATRKRPTHRAVGSRPAFILQVASEQRQRKRVGEAYMAELASGHRRPP